MLPALSLPYRIMLCAPWVRLASSVSPFTVTFAVSSML